MGAEGLSFSVNGLVGGAPLSNLTDKYSDYKLNDDRYGGGFNLVYNKDNISLFGGFNYNKKNVIVKRYLLKYSLLSNNISIGYNL